MPNPEKQTPFPVIMTNAVTAMLAGSDTTAVALCNAFYCVLAHPDAHTRLRAELDAAFPSGADEPVEHAWESVGKADPAIKVDADALRETGGGVAGWDVLVLFECDALYKDFDVRGC